MREARWPQSDALDSEKSKEKDDQGGISRRSVLKGLFAFAALKISGTDKLAATVLGNEGSPEEIESALVAVEKRAAELGPVFENIYQGERQEISPEAWRTVDAIFSGPLEPVREWNRELVREGRYAHIAAYLLQAFRNSEEATWLRETYNSLPKEKRPQFEAKVRERVRDPITYELMFKVGLRPIVFDPREDPGNTTETHPIGESTIIEVVRNPKGQTVYSGTDKYYFDDPGSIENEGNISFIYNEDGGRVTIVNYFKNAQPNFRFIRDTGNNSANPNDFDFFKTYLGDDLKGKDLYYSAHKEGEETWERRMELTDAQVEAMKKFFRWR